MPDPTDPDIRAFVAASRERTFSAMAVEIAAEFGPGRAWSVDLVAAVHHQLLPPREAGRRSPFEREPAVMAFITDRDGLVSMAEIARLGAEAFGSGRFPSKSAVGRLALRLRQRATVAAS
ncbi:MAG TPA: hypothetical protein VHZ26_04835 [Caulobacteraceae bacterium]|jgi:hypothetical protein|nr:hypothetical protein [Caulobacteraceae bacterium]